MICRDAGLKSQVKEYTLLMAKKLFINRLPTYFTSFYKSNKAGMFPALFLYEMPNDFHLINLITVSWLALLGVCAQQANIGKLADQ